MRVRIKRNRLQDSGFYHTDFSNVVMCPNCGMKLFIPITRENGKKGTVKVIFMCIFCEERLITTVAY